MKTSAKCGFGGAAGLARTYKMSYYRQKVSHAAMLLDRESEDREVCLPHLSSRIIQLSSK